MKAFKKTWMKIVFRSTPDRFKFPFRIIGSAGRYDTISDCEFLNENKIVCVDRQMARLYLIRFDLSGGTHRILDSKECLMESGPFHFEILALQGNKVYSVDYGSNIFTCTIEGDKFKDAKILKGVFGEAYHGICNAGEKKLYITNMLKNNITEVHLDSRIRKSLPCEGGVRMKDAAVLDAMCYVALSSDRGPVNGTRRADGTVSPYNTPYDSHVLLYDRKSGALIRRLALERTQIDGCAFHKGLLFVTCTDEFGSGFLLRCKVDTEYNFQDVARIPCGGFPHGVAVRDGLLAYTSYTDSALYILPMSATGDI